MPTKLRRIAVTVDPALEEALGKGAVRFPGRSSSALLRELAMLGAAELSGRDEEETKLDRLLARPGVTPPEGGLAEFLSEREDRSVEPGVDPYAGTKALAEQRAEDL